MSRDHVDTCATWASSLIVAAVVVAGLTILCAENLGGRPLVRQIQIDHSTAIHNLLFRT
jgi:hypothetical protein